MTTAPNDIIRLTCKYSYTSGGRSISNVLHFVDNGGGGILDALLLTGMGTIMEGIFGPFAPAQCVKLFFTTYDVFNVTQATIIGTLPWPTLTTGIIAGELSVSTAVGLLRLVTAKSRVQGRINLVGLPEGGVSDSRMLAGTIAAALATGATLLTPFVLGPSALQYVVYNQVLATFNLPVAVALGENTRSIGRRRLP